MDRNRKTLLTLLLTYCMASLVHFIHNARYLSDYPNMPAAWSAVDVYGAWIGLTAIGATGWILLSRNYERSGLLILSVYALLGLDSLGHYVLAPFADHSATMNTTIMFEVLAAASVLMVVLIQVKKRVHEEQK